MSRCHFLPSHVIPSPVSPGGCREGVAGRGQVSERDGLVANVVVERVLTESGVSCVSDADSSLADLDVRSVTEMQTL